MASGDPKVIEIDTFRPEHAKRFAELNRAWLEAYNLLEPPDEEQLADPEKYLIQRGGHIFVALHAGDVVGTCAVVPHGPGDLELVKLSVSPASQGQGLGRRMVERCITYARERGFRRMVLVSNSQLRAALRLYESMGFQYRPLPAIEYVTADVYMELDL